METGCWRCRREWRSHLCAGPQKGMSANVAPCVSTRRDNDQSLAWDLVCLSLRGSCSEPNCWVLYSADNVLHIKRGRLGAAPAVKPQMSEGAWLA
jgi:hypothetical protein